jgi:hypothetical protein
MMVQGIIGQQQMARKTAVQVLATFLSSTFTTQAQTVPVLTMVDVQKLIGASTLLGGAKHLMVVDKILTDVLT